MNNQSGKRRISLSYIVLGIGALMFLCNLAYTARFLYLDLFGEKTSGVLTIDSYGCRGSKGGRSTCYDATVKFQDAKGTYYEFNAGLAPILWNLVTFADTDRYAVDVTYNKTFPFFAKMNYPLHLEYLGELNITAIIVFIAGLYLVFNERRRALATASAIGNLD